MRILAVGLLTVVSICSIFCGVGRAADAAAPQKFRVYFGTYTGAQSKGIYHSTLDLATGQLSPPQLAAEIKSPSFVAIHPSRKFLYAVSEISDRPTPFTVFAMSVPKPDPMVVVAVTPVTRAAEASVALIAAMAENRTAARVVRFEVI